MNDHDAIRSLLPAAAADLVGPEEERRIRRHLSQCESCRRERDQWLVVTDGLRRLPQPVIPSGLVERTQTLALQQTKENAAHRELNWWLAGILVWGWLSNGAVLFSVRAVLGIGRPVLWFGIWMVLAWVTAGSAAVMLGHRTANQEGANDGPVS
jgi:anti-sigma factor RsiW